MLTSCRIRPILYRVAILREPLGEPLTATWRNARITDISQFVRHVLAFTYETDIVELIIPFRNIENLAIWDDLGICFESLKALDGLPLRMLSASMSMKLREAIKNSSAFKNLTHLELLSLYGPVSNECKALVELPKLSHLCLDFYVEDEIVLDLLEHCASLRVLILRMDVKLFVYRTTKVDDPRYLVFRDSVYIEDCMLEWSRSANGLLGCWELAEVIIEARKSRLFKNNSSYNFSRDTWMTGLNDDGIRWYEEWSRHRWQEASCGRVSRTGMFARG
jgi:hypothetical protein